MKTLIYGGQHLLVTDAVADVSLDYAAALTQSSLADSVTIPTFTSYGMPDEVTLVLGPTLPLLAVEAPDDVLGDDASCTSATTADYLQNTAARAYAIRS